MMNWQKYKREFLWIGAAAIIFGFYYWRYRVPAKLELDQIAIELAPGQTTTLGQARQGAEVVHFYAHWCGPCLREIRMINTEQQRLMARGLDFIFLTDDTWAQIEQMKMLAPANVRIARVNNLKELGVYTIPATYVVNKDNRVVFERIDACEWADSLFLQQLDQLLAQ